MPDTQQAAPATWPAQLPYNPPWLSAYDERAQKVIRASVDYFSYNADAGLPGHNLMMAIAALCRHIDEGVDTLSHAVPMPHAAAAPPDDVQGKFTAPPQPRGAEPCTDKQLKAIYAIGYNEHQWTDGQTEAVCIERYGRNPAQISKSQASEFIDALKGGTK